MSWNTLDIIGEYKDTATGELVVRGYREYQFTAGEEASDTNEIRIPLSVINNLKQQGFNRKTIDFGWIKFYNVVTTLIVEIGVGFDENRKPIYQGNVFAAETEVDRKRLYTVNTPSLRDAVEESCKFVKEETTNQLQSLLKSIDEDIETFKLS